MSKRGLSTDGLKADLVSRLQQRLDEEEFGMDEGIEAPEADATVPEKDQEKVSPAKKEKKVSPVKEKVEDPEKKERKEEEKPVVEETKVVQTVTEKNSEAPVEVNVKVSTSEKDSNKETEETKKEMTFEEKKAARAARFGIAVVKNVTPLNEKKGKKRQQKGTPKQNKKQKGADNKGKKKNEPKTSTEGKGGKSQELLPEAEIKKRLDRMKQYNIDDKKKEDQLKAMLRQHRFQGK